MIFINKKEISFEGMVKMGDKAIVKAIQGKKIEAGAPTDRKFSRRLNPKIVANLKPKIRWARKSCGNKACGD